MTGEAPTTDIGPRASARRGLNRALGVGLLLVASCARAGGDNAASSSADGEAAQPFVPSGASADASAVDDAASAPAAPSTDGAGDDGLTEADPRAPTDASTGSERSSEAATRSGEGTPPVESAPAPNDTTADAALPTANDASSGAGAPDASLAVDAGSDDAPSIPCAQSCTSGCCNPIGTCLPGTTDVACGAAGATCQDCSPAGQTCQSQACLAPPTPAPTVTSTPPPSAPACDVSSCTNLCIPYFVQCCKADETCGCALFFPRGSCN